MRIFLLIGFFLVFQISFTQIKNKNHATKVSYKQYNNGKINEKSSVSFIYMDNVVYLSASNDKVRSYIDFENGQNVDIMKYNESLYKTITSFDKLGKPKFLNEEETIEGYKCKKALFSAFSNKIEVWYTEESPIKGSPYKNYLPSKNAFVLKIVINGNRELRVNEIKELKEQQKLNFPINDAKEITQAEFEEYKIKSRYVTFPIFENETINFDPSIKTTSVDGADDGKTLRFSNGTVILKKIKFPKEVKKNAQVYAKLTNISNGDAYDRTGTVFILPVKQIKKTLLDGLVSGIDKLPKYFDNDKKEYQGIVSDEAYDTPIEIMRFFTSFGVGHFNNLRVINNYPWKNSVTYKQDITTLIPTDQEEIWVGVFIGNYDKGGHKVSLEFNYYPSWEENKEIKRWIQPAFSTLNVMEMSGQNYGRLFKNDTLKAVVTIPKNIKNPQLLFTSTGHGGWGGGDEFNQKLNEIFIDGKLVYSVVPWRTDCATYRYSNPASGNFFNGLSSSDLSRSNWCPATLTPPYIIPLHNLEPGTHTIEVVIDQGDDEGSSFSHWNVSGILIGEKQLK
ncbi:PNGase F N-terminal domain-containing protein [uncultured Lutibacter sp.]|uniref:PNGase F N-terminal domain-containing protein n=1 Tax=uncultured Lutibacter sp. TaxID=437739 RepID=UPI00261992D9|nr:PNGase F N-terminal domain-containing protein [uncultured Lutibacter sp.]